MLVYIVYAGEVMHINPKFIHHIQVKAWESGIYTGTITPENRQIIDRCRHVHLQSGTVLIFSRDGDFHASGWIKNPDFSRCYHLSLSFFDPRTGCETSQNKKKAGQWCESLFGTQYMSWLLIESPKSSYGKQKDVWHYRLFCDENWQVILPRGEPYHTLRTETGWKTWSEIHQQEKSPIILPPGVE